MTTRPNRTVPSLDCETAREEIQTFAGTRVPAARARVLRAHLLECAECKRFYRASLGTAARVGRNLRSGREAGESLREEERRAAYRSLGKLEGKRPNHSALRTILLPAFFFFLMVVVTRLAWPGDSVEAVEWSGPVYLDDVAFGSDGPPDDLDRGVWVVTGDGGKLRLEAGSATLALGEGTFVQVEAPDAHRFRFRGGELTVTGPLTVTTAFGVFDLPEGTAHLAGHGTRFDLRCDAGSGVFTDARGAHPLAAGETLERGIR